MRTLTDIRLYTSVAAVESAMDILAMGVLAEGDLLHVRTSDGNTYTLGRGKSIICSCEKKGENSNVMATLLRGADGQGVVGGYIDEHGVLHLTMTDGTTVVAGEIPLDNYPTKTEVAVALDEKVDKVEGMGLSAVNFTEVMRAKLASLNNYDDSDVRAKIERITYILNSLTTGESSTAIDSWHDVLHFLNGLEQTDELDNIIEGLERQIFIKQDKLVSGENIKTINGETIVGEGNIEIKGGSADLEGYATEEYVDNAVEAVNVRGEDGYLYSNGEKVDMRIRRSLIPIGTLIPANADLKTIAYLKVGNYYCSQTSNAKTIKNCPVDVAFSMEVFNPLSEILDDETTAQYTYRIRKITAYNTGVQYIQYCNTSGTAGTWTYDSWYVVPRTSFSLASDKNGGSAVKGGSKRGVYIDASGTFQQMGYTIEKSVPSNAVFTDTNTKVTAVGNHYAPVEDESVVIEAPAGEVVIGLKRDAAGHVVGVMSTPMSGGGGGGGIAVETDPVFSASPAAAITDEKIAEWDNKYTKPSGGIPQSDLAEEVKRALRKAEQYTGVVTEIKVNGNNIGASGGVVDLGNLGTYSKPSTGIPKSDLDSSVQASLGKADTAVQPADIKDVVYIADFTMASLKRGMKDGTNVDCNIQALVTAMNANQVILVREDEGLAYSGVYVLNGYAEDLLYFSIVDSSGNILWCDGTNYTDASYIEAGTLHFHSWWEKQDALVSGENIKTINGESIVGSGNITISGSGSAQLPLYNVIKILNGSTLAIPSGKVTELALQQTGGGTFALSLSDKKVGEDNVWAIRFAISIDNLGIYQVVADEGYSIKWANGVAPTFEKGKFYELSFRLVGQTFLGVWASFE